jgi:hypothetical protein
MTRSFSVGSYTRSIDAQEDPFTSRVMAIKNDDASGLEDNFENWPKERVREAVDGLQREDKARQDAASDRQTGDTFIAGHPEYVDNEANAKLMQHELFNRFGAGRHSLEQFEQAYEALRASNFLKLNQAEVARQQKAAAKQRYEAQRAPSVEPSIEEIESMSLEEIRMRDAIENQKRMERIGAEGGW